MAITTKPQPLASPAALRTALPQDRPEPRRSHASSDDQAALLIDHVTKRFELGRKKRVVTAVDDVSLRVERGEVYGILGANGGGKSTLIRLVSTLLTIDAGRVEVFGHDVERDEMAVKRLFNRVSADAAFVTLRSPVASVA